MGFFWVFYSVVYVFAGDGLRVFHEPRAHPKIKRTENTSVAVLDFLFPTQRLLFDAASPLNIRSIVLPLT
jgi:hypothetical protein